MKKVLLAILLGGATTLAQAQSSVTVYGILDVGYSGVSTRTGDVKTQTNKMDQGAQVPSRLGFKGVEDLGGGTSAFFTTEMALFPQDATLSGNNYNGLYNRQTFVGLKQKGIGSFALGTQYTPIFNAMADTDAGDLNDTIGSVLFPSFNDGTTSPAFTIRASNALTVQSERFSGVSATGMYTVKNTNTTQTGPANAAGTKGGTYDITGYALGGDYVHKKFLATVAYQSFKNDNPSTVVSPWATAMTNNYGSNVIDNQTYVGTTYDFGILKAYAGWINRKSTSILNSSEYLQRTAQQVGIRTYLTPRVEGWATVGNGRYTAYGINQPTANFNAYQVGANYWLSKRTNLYAILGSSQTSSTSSVSAAAANQYATGIRHTF